MGGDSMLSKFVKSLSVVLILTVLFFGYNNCAPVENRSPASNDLEDSPDKSMLTDPSGEFMEKVMSGTSIASNSAPDCIPTIYQDFMDNISWDKRRLVPRDCAVLKLSRPIFYWPIPADIGDEKQMTFRLNVKGYIPFYSNPNMTVPHFLYPGTLAAGFYEWRVEYKNSDGLLVTSAPHRFTIPSGTLFKIPTGAEILAISKAKARPRAKPYGASFGTIAARAKQGEYAPSFDAFLKKVAAYTTPPAPPVEKTRADFSSDSDYQTWVNLIAWQAGEELEAIEALGYGYQLTGASNYQDRALTRVLSLASWDVNGITSEAKQTQANRAIGLALGEGLDLLQNRMTTAQRLKVVSALRTRLNNVMNKYPNFDTGPYDSLLLTSTLYTTQALMFAVGTPGFEDADDLLVKAWDRMISLIGPFGGAIDGGYGNGSGYGWHMVRYLARMVANVQLIANVNLTLWPAINGTITSRIAFSPANQKLRGQMGDDAELDNLYFSYWKEMRLLAAVSGFWDQEWYWRANPAAILKAEAMYPAHYLMLGVRIPVAPPSSYKLPNSYLYEDAGYVMMHSNTMDPLRSSVFFRSSPLGSAGHSHADNNAFTFVSQGKEMLISGGYYDTYMSNHHQAVTRTTRYKNALTYNGGIGQAEPVAYPTGPGRPVLTMDTRGKLLNYDDNGTWVVATGDASLAYRGLVSNSPRSWRPLIDKTIRSVIYNRVKKVVLIYDWAQHRDNRGWELNFQPVSFKLMENNELMIINGAVSACLNVNGPPMGRSISGGYPYLPKNAVDHQLVRYAVTTQSKELVAVTVIREDCTKNNVSVQISGTKATISIDGEAALVADQTWVTTP